MTFIGILPVSKHLHCLALQNTASSKCVKRWELCGFVYLSLNVCLQELLQKFRCFELGLCLAHSKVF